MQERHYPFGMLGLTDPLEPDRANPIGRREWLLPRFPSPGQVCQGTGRALAERIPESIERLKAGSATAGFSAR